MRACLGDPQHLHTMSKKVLFCLVFTGVWGETTATMELLAEEKIARR